MTITEQLAEALRVLSESFEHGWAKETRSETIEAVEKIARSALAAYEASKAEEERMDCYQYGKVPAAYEASKASGEQSRIATLFDTIAHGDDIHRGWLKEAIDNHFNGLPVPPPRAATTNS